MITEYRRGDYCIMILIFSASSIRAGTDARGICVLFALIDVMQTLMIFGDSISVSAQL
jgi:hypothetical protein